MANPYTPPTTSSDTQTRPVSPEVVAQINRPASVIIILALANVGLDIYGLAEDIYFPTKSRLPTLGVPELAILMTLHTLQAIGGIQMRTRGSYVVAYVGALTCCIPCMSPFWILGIPFGIWATRVLSRPDSKLAFNPSIA